MSLSIEIKTIEESPNYNNLNEKWSGLTLVKAIVTKKGTVGGNPTVDLQLEGWNGEKYIAMVKGSLLESLGDIIKTVREE